MAFFYICLEKYIKKAEYGNAWQKAMVPAHKDGVLDSEGITTAELAFQDGPIEWYPIFNKYFKKDVAPWWEDAHWIAPLSESGIWWFHTRNAKDVAEKLPKIIERIKAEQFDKCFFSFINNFIFKLSVLLEWAKLYQNVKASFSLFFFEY